jgi:hypothetical protein
MLSIEPASHCSGDEELRAVRVRTGISHGEQKPLVVLIVEILVLEFIAVNAFTTSALQDY